MVTQNVTFIVHVPLLLFSVQHATSRLDQSNIYWWTDAQFVPNNDSSLFVTGGLFLPRAHRSWIGDVKVPPGRMIKLDLNKQSTDLRFYNVYYLGANCSSVWRVVAKIHYQSPIKGLCCLLEQETLPSLLSTGWFQERIWAWFHNRTKINWGFYGRLT